MQHLLLLTFALLTVEPAAKWEPGVRALEAGHAAEAEALFAQVCPALRAESGGEYGYCLLLLGMAQQGSGRIDAARESFHASAALLRNGGPQFLEALAMSYRYLGELDGSEELLRRALTIQAQLADPLPAAATGRRLADLLCQQPDRLDESQALLREAAAVFAATPDAFTVERIELDATRARLLLAKGNYHEARQLYFEVLRAKQTYFGPIHQRTAQANLDLAAALRAEGETARAMPLVRRAEWIQSRLR